MVSRSRLSGTAGGALGACVTSVGCAHCTNGVHRSHHCTRRRVVRVRHQSHVVTMGLGKDWQQESVDRSEFWVWPPTRAALTLPSAPQEGTAVAKPRRQGLTESKDEPWT